MKTSHSETQMTALKMTLSISKTSWSASKTWVIVLCSLILIQKNSTSSLLLHKTLNCLRSSSHPGFLANRCQLRMFAKNNSSHWLKHLFLSEKTNLVLYWTLYRVALMLTQKNVQQLMGCCIPHFSEWINTRKPTQSDSRKTLSFTDHLWALFQCESLTPLELSVNKQSKIQWVCSKDKRSS